MPSPPQPQKGDRQIFSNWTSSTSWILLSSLLNCLPVVWPLVVQPQRRLWVDLPKTQIWPCHSPEIIFTLFSSIRDKVTISKYRTGSPQESRSLVSIFSAPHLAHTSAHCCCYLDYPFTPIHPLKLPSPCCLLGPLEATYSKRFTPPPHTNNFPCSFVPKVPCASPVP